MFHVSLARKIAIILFIGFWTGIALGACSPMPVRTADTPTPAPTATETPVPATPTPALPAQVGPRVPHTTEGRGDCLACHLSMWPVPASHEGRDNKTCQTCHIQQTAQVPVIAHRAKGREACTTCHADNQIAPLPADHAGRSDRVCLICHTKTVASVPAIAHDTQSKSMCSGCHAVPPATSIANIPGLPASHGGRNDKMCPVCHESSLTVPTIAHKLDGHDKCALCHAKQAMAPLPASHDQRTESMCVMCHAQTPNLVIPALAHNTGGGRTACTGCHAEGKMANALPADHKGRSDGMCLACHDPMTNPPPAIAHLVKGKEVCTQCHGPQGIIALPASHARRGGMTCGICHEKETPVPNAPHTTADKPNCTVCHSAKAVGALPASHAKRTDAMCTICHSPVATLPAVIPHSLEGRQDCTMCHPVKK